MILYSSFFVIFLIAILFYLKFKNYVPILMYHRIAAVPHDRNALPPAKFAQQLAYLNSHGFHTITMRQLCDYYQNNVPLPAKPILLTFDDGYADNLTHALPLLLQYNMTATVFPIANWLGRPNAWENFHKPATVTMSRSELAQWLNAGMEIGSHTCEHPFLTKCDANSLAQELSQSKTYLEHTFKRPINFLCYPYGFFNDNVIAAAKQAGYQAAFAIFDGVPLWKLNLMALPRVPIPANQSLWEFKLKVTPFHIVLIALRQTERALKRLRPSRNH